MEDPKTEKLEQYNNCLFVYDCISHTSFCVGLRLVPLQVQAATALQARAI